MGIQHKQVLRMVARAEKDRGRELTESLPKQDYHVPRCGSLQVRNAVAVDISDRHHTGTRTGARRRWQASLHPRAIVQVQTDLVETTQRDVRLAVPVRITRFDMVRGTGAQEIMFRKKLVLLKHTWYIWTTWSQWMNKTIYIRDDDTKIWDRAKGFAGDKLSRVIIAGLHQYVALQEAKINGFERIEVKLFDALDKGMPKVKAFTGRWVITPDNPRRRSDQRGDYEECYALALTAKGAVVIYQWGEIESGRVNETFLVYPSLENAVHNENINFLITEAMDRIGVPVEELDI